MANEQPDYMSKGEGGKLANAAYQTGKAAKTTAKVGAKVAAQNYAGAAKDVAISYGKEIITVVIAASLALIILFITLFNSGPSLVFNNIDEWMDNKKVELTFNEAEKTIYKQMSKAENDCYNDILKNIKDGYIPDFTKYFNAGYFDDDFVKNNGYRLKQGNGTSTPNEYYIIQREKSTNNLLFIYTVGAPTDINPVTRIVRINDAYSNEENSMDTLYLTLAYSVYHQKNDVGSYNDEDDGKDYDEPQGENKEEDRWNEVSTKGLKKFLKDNRKKLVNAKYKATKENIELYLNGDTVQRTAEVLNVTINTVNASDKTVINELFKLSDDDISTVDSYYTIACELFEE